MLSQIFIEAYSTDITVVVGGNVYLPCNISIQVADDVVTLILWYKDDTGGAPIYSVDARSHQPVETAKHFSSDFFGNRASFNLSVQPALLKIDPVMRDDDGVYKCRVDFRWGRTMTTATSLAVIGMTILKNILK